MIGSRALRQTHRCRVGTDRTKSSPLIFHHPAWKCPTCPRPSFQVDITTRESMFVRTSGQTTPSGESNRVGRVHKEHKRAPDEVVSATRSRLMSRVKQRNTAPEVVVRRTIHKWGFRFRLHTKTLPGTPDIVIPRYRKLVFVNGCFWHRHTNCRRATTPKTRMSFWEEKFANNVVPEIPEILLI